MRIDELAVRQKALADWNSSAEVRAEFGGDFKSYEAYAVADARGLVQKVRSTVKVGNSHEANRAAMLYRARNAQA